MIKRWLTLRTILALGAVLLFLGATIAWLETTHFRESEYAKFSNQSIHLASVFARSASAWLVRGNDEALKFAANLMLAGSGQYVRIVVEDVIVLDERRSDPEIEALDLTLDLLGSDFDGAQSSLRRGGLDVVVPVEIPTQPSESLGTVQIGFSDAQARSKVRSHRLLIFGLAASSWLVLMLASVFSARLVSLRSRLSAVDSLAQEPDGIIHCGELTIDAETCAVRLFEKEIELTPKTFELLTFFARHEGKTFSDADLLAALWGDAPYAASGDVKQCIYMLRRRLSAACADPKQIIVNVKGFGYKLESPTEAMLSND